MADEMTREEFAGALGGFETRLNARLDEQFRLVDEEFQHVDAQFRKVDEQFTHVDEQFSHVHKQFQHVDAQFRKVDEQFTHVDEQFSHVHKQFQHADERFRHVDEQVIGIHTRLARLQDDMDDQFGRVKMQLDELRSDIKFGLEAREGRREAMERRFDEARERDEAQYDLLKQVLHHVRGRVEHLERRHDTP